MKEGSWTNHYTGLLSPRDLLWKRHYGNRPHPYSVATRVWKTITPTWREVSSNRTWRVEWPGTVTGLTSFLLVGDHWGHSSTPEQLVLNVEFQFPISLSGPPFFLIQSRPFLSTGLQNPLRWRTFDLWAHNPRVYNFVFSRAIYWDWSVYTQLSSFS